MYTMLTRPCTKWSYQIQSIEEIHAVVQEAFAVAMSGKRGPVHLDLPKDVMTATLEGALLPPPYDPHVVVGAAAGGGGRARVLGALPPGTSAPSELTAEAEEALQRVVALLRTARKPLIYAGQGVVDAAEPLAEL
eukprot:g7481.t1